MRKQAKILAFMQKHPYQGYTFKDFSFWFYNLFNLSPHVKYSNVYLTRLSKKGLICKCGTVGKGQKPCNMYRVTQKGLNFKI